MKLSEINTNINNLFNFNFELFFIDIKLAFNYLTYNQILISYN